MDTRVLPKLDQISLNKSICAPALFRASDVECCQALKAHEYVVCQYHTHAEHYCDRSTYISTITLFFLSRLNPY